MIVSRIIYYICIRINGRISVCYALMNFFYCICNNIVTFCTIIYFLFLIRGYIVFYFYFFINSIINISKFVFAYFNTSEAASGSDFSAKIAEAVTNLTDNIRLDVEADFSHNENGAEKKYEFPFEIKRLERVSPTLGMKPPKGAIVLFNGSNFSEWRASNNKPIAWKIDKKEKSMMGARDANNQSSDIETKRKFKNCRLHIEFMTPDQSGRGMGQSRGNSGVFFGRFEVQVLDSFGAQGDWDECGALYRFMPPQINACLPPERWQTYDIVFYGAKDKNGRLERNPRITVYHNGMKIHNDVEIWEGTDYNSRDKNLKNLREHAFPIKLQWHSEPVKFRNIWIEEIKDEDVVIPQEIITKKNFRE